MHTHKKEWLIGIRAMSENMNRSMYIKHKQPSTNPSQSSARELVRGACALMRARGTWASWACAHTQLPTLSAALLPKPYPPEHIRCTWHVGVVYLWDIIAIILVCLTCLENLGVWALHDRIECWFVDCELLLRIFLNYCLDMFLVCFWWRDSSEIGCFWLSFNLFA